jgi:hypothetical protein
MIATRMYTGIVVSLALPKESKASLPVALYACEAAQRAEINSMILDHKRSSYW